MVQTQHQTNVGTIRSDNGTEFLCLKEHFLQLGILHETSCVGTPQQNGRVERKHRHIPNIARALRFQAHLPIEFWGECILAAGYLINRTPSSILGGLTPYEKIHGKLPTYDHIKVFGSLCYAHNQETKGDKFSPRGRRCVFMGYPYGKKGLRLFDLEKQEFWVSRDVVFFEDQFPYVNLKRDEETATTTPVVWESITGADMYEEDGPQQPNTQINETLGREVSPAQPARPIIPLIPPTAQPAMESSSSSTSQPAIETREPAVVTIPEPELGRGQRRRQPPVTLKNFVTNSAQTRLLGSSSNGKELMYPITNYVSYGRFSACHTAYQVSTGKITPPKSYKKAVEDERFKKAMGTEITR